MNERISTQAAGGRARGIVVGSLFALGWWIYGASIFADAVRPFGLAAAIILTIALVVVSARVMLQVRTMPAAAAAAIAVNKRAWRWFWLNLIGEIVLLNVAITLLEAPHRRVYWIAAISGVVGLHFLPMAIFFRTKSYWFVGVAMMVGAVVAASFIARSGMSAADIASIEALANAVILWSSLGPAALSLRSSMPKLG